MTPETRFLHLTLAITQDTARNRVSQSPVEPKVMQSP
jgi:hypothetical protein